MRPVVSTLRRVASPVCQARKFSFNRFMEEYGLEGVLTRADASDWNDLEIAAHLLSDCCVEDGTFNNFVVGFLTAITFLNERRGAIEGQQVAAQDLLAILKQGGQLSAILQWMHTHYP